MKAFVDQDICIGCGQCVMVCPQVFKMEGDKATVIQKPVEADNEAGAREAAEICPVAAISLS